MAINRPYLVWIFVSFLFCSTNHLAAQCSPPGAFWLHSPQTSNALTFNWSAANDATHYQIRYWETAGPGDKTLISDYVTAPYVLDGLKKNTTYTVQIRSVCGNAASIWSTPVNYLTAKTFDICTAPTGVVATPQVGALSVGWTSTGSHTIRYRLGYSGDWLIPSGAITVSNPPFVISGLPTGTYQIEVKHNCASTSSNFLRVIRSVTEGCATPAAPLVIPDATSASVILPSTNGVTGYTVQYRLGTIGNWQTVGIDVPPSLCYINPPFIGNTEYQVRIQAICGAGSSDFSLPVAFRTLANSTCLANKDFGKNINGAEILQIKDAYNRPSPFSLGTMIGVNDGGLIFRSFQNELTNQITRLTDQFRNFHTMDEDFDNSLVSYAQNIKPKNTNPEGTPSNMAYNKGLYNLYHNTHGFKNITAATELLQYSPQTWKEKIYQESDWSAAGSAGIKSAFENYVKTFIDACAPANGTENQRLVANFQVGNELWDYPVKSDYHSLLYGASSAFNSKYGPKSEGRWNMNLVVGAFQAYRDNTCQDTLRDYSNCGGSLDRHDFIGDYLDVTDCQVLKELDAIDCHPYSFLPGTISWTYPENPVSDGSQIINLAGWRDANRDTTSGILQNTRLWSSEYGFDSNPVTGVGELTQSAYLIRGLLLHSRYHFEKVYFYNAYDHSRTTDPYYTGLYNSTGFWKLGTHPLNNAWPSPLEAHGATPKPSWYGMLDLKARFGEHVFYKALVEDAEASVYLLAKSDGSDPYLVFWSPQATTDANINTEIPVSKLVDWSDVLPGNYMLGDAVATLFAVSPQSSQTFAAMAGEACGASILTAIRRNPAFVRLVPCFHCPNVASFQRHPNLKSSCNSEGDYFYEVVINNVTVNDQLTLSGLPNNGLFVNLSALNGVPLNNNTFNANLHYVNGNSLRWHVNANNGTTQRLQLYYCWADQYPNPVSSTTVTSACSSVTTPCSVVSNRDGMEGDERGESTPKTELQYRFSVMPNPGTDRMIVSYDGPPAEQANLRVISATGQLILNQVIPFLEHHQQWQIEATGLSGGLYYLCLQTNKEMRYQIWEKY